MSTTTLVKIDGIPLASPFSVLNGRTGVVTSRRASRFGTFLVILSQPISAEDVRLSDMASLADLTEDSEGREVEILGTYLEDAESVEPGREVPAAIVNAAFAEIGAAYRRSQRHVGATIAERAAMFDATELWGMVRETITRQDLAALIPESVVTSEDARAWVYAQAAATHFGF
jgi:hypothetical protein